MSDEDHVVYVLASLPDSYNVLVTALEANAEVPKIEVVTERILHQERKTKEKETDSTNENAMPSHTVSRRPKPKCFNCGKLGHIQRYCRAKREDQDWIKEDQKERKDFHKQKVTVSVDNDSDTNGDDTQREGLDYDETFSPVVRSESIRSVISLACKEGLKLHQMDVTTAFLNGELDQVIYMRQPEGFAADGQEYLVCRLKKSLYGLKQSSRCRNQVLDAQLKGMGFQQSQSDPCIYTSKKDGLFIIAVYVDDILLCAKSEKTIAQVKQDLEKCFQLKDMGELHYFLGINVKRNYETGKMWIGQPEYTKAVLKNFGMEKCKPANTPVTSGTKLLKATDESKRVDSKLYQSAVGCLLYLSGWTRPDIAYSVGNVARFCSDPTEEHWTAVKRIFRYLQGTANYGLEYSKQNGDGNLVGFSDADWAGDPNDRKSTSGYIFVMNGGAISWKSRKQTCVALSTAEAEYVALASAAQETAWIRQLLNDLHHQQDDPTILYEDNQAAVAISKNSQLHTKMKHIAIRYHYVREKALDKTIDVQYCPTNDMVADILTKGLTLDKFLKFRELSGIKDLSDLK